MKNNLVLKIDEVSELLSPVAIRDRAAKIFALTKNGDTSFEYHHDKLEPVVDYVISVIKKNYPDLKIPFHSRWGHFRAGKVDRVSQLNKRIEKFDALERARIKLDLVITSVLLDAGAGAKWRYTEKETDGVYSRSEGLGVASFHMFMHEVFSSDRKSLRADSVGLSKVTENDLREAFQVSEENPLVGVEGRVALLKNLGKAVENKEMFKDGRPGNIVDYLMSRHGNKIPATALLRAVLDGFGPIWPGRLSADGKNLGDVWTYPKLGESASGLVPFHKLSQWMTYSLIEPINEAGCEVTGVHELTGLAEYRNGGLMIDSGLISLRDPAHANEKWKPDSQLIIEWRALTVHLLDEIGSRVRNKLGFTPEQFPLAKVLEGGTWWAGRFLAQEKRLTGDPPLSIDSDGTVF